ncbi:hypothetical protein SDC9_112219 [bioreactor metagenome]|uniref:Uncharacterized protein n=1 Tax=bioreactor metagenome TaxID=1076179 RepID=A0A645BU52_9ZZZZ
MDVPRKQSASEYIKNNDKLNFKHDINIVIQIRKESLDEHIGCIFFF